MKEILFFSKNPNKISEISNLFLNSSIKILNLDSYKKIRSPNENGKTFEDNARIKSLYGLKNFKKICFADDSGICIEALKGNPGVYSKKFLSENGGQLKALEKIIEEVKLKKNYSAFFQTTICLSLNKNDHLFFTGKIYGNISNNLRGLSGFGYDPIFIPNGARVTFAEMTQKRKNLISHRGLAIKKLRKFLISV